LKLRFLSVIRAKLRTEILAAGRPPGFDVTVAGTEWLVAESAADRAAIHQIPAARYHQIPPPSEKQNTVLGG